VVSASDLALSVLLPTRTAAGRAHRLLGLGDYARVPDQLLQTVVDRRWLPRPRLRVEDLRRLRRARHLVRTTLRSSSSNSSPLTLAVPLAQVDKQQRARLNPPAAQLRNKGPLFPRRAVGQEEAPG